MLDWMAAAACKDKPLDWWFPEFGDAGPGRGNRVGGQYQRARDICDRCPVRAECLDEAMRMERGVSHNFRHGMVGGLTPREREALSRKRRVSA